MSGTANTMEEDIRTLERNLYIITGVLSVVISLVIVLCMILYYWVNTLEKKITKVNVPDYKIRRAQLREKFPQNPDADSTIASNFRFTNQPNDMYQDNNNYRNPLGNNNIGNQQPNHRNSAVIDEIRRNPRHTEQQLHQNFYGVDNGNFQY